MIDYFDDVNLSKDVFCPSNAFEWRKQFFDGNISVSQIVECRTEMSLNSLFDPKIVSFVLYMITIQNLQLRNLKPLFVHTALVH